MIDNLCRRHLDVWQHNIEYKDSFLQTNYKFLTMCFKLHFKNEFTKDYKLLSSWLLAVGLLKCNGSSRRIFRFASTICTTRIRITCIVSKITFKLSFKQKWKKLLNLFNCLQHDIDITSRLWFTENLTFHTITFVKLIQNTVGSN